MFRGTGNGRGFFRWVSWCLGGGLLALASGCGTGRYEARLDQTLERQRQEAKFQVLRPGIALSDTAPIFVGLPKGLEPINRETQLEGKDKAISPKRLSIPFVKTIPGLTLTTYEGLVRDAQQGRIPYYVYLGTAKAVSAPAAKAPEARKRGDGQASGAGQTSGAGRDAANALALAVKEAFPKANAAWQTVKLETPKTGETLEWKRLRVTGPQEFVYIDQQNDESFRMLPGIFDAYTRQQDDLQLFIIWRVPESLAPIMSLDTVAPLVAGSLVAR